MILQLALNGLSDFLRPVQQNALLKILIKTFLRKYILNADAAFMNFAVETKCFRKNSTYVQTKYFRQTAELSVHISAFKTDIKKRLESY